MLRAFNRECTAVRLYDLARDRKPKSAAAGRGGEVAFDAIEALENVRQMLFADADAAIAHVNGDAFALIMSFDHDRRAIRRKLERVFDEVQERVAEQIRIAV